MQPVGDYIPPHAALPIKMRRPSIEGGRFMCRQQPSDFRSIRAIEALPSNSLVFQHNCHINLRYVHELRHRRQIRFQEWTPRIIFFVAVVQITCAQQPPPGCSHCRLWDSLAPEITFLRVGALTANVRCSHSQDKTIKRQ